ncbi:PE family protein PE27A, partial [Mycobacterium tuberculosis TB_RSA120]
ALTARLAAAH